MICGIRINGTRNRRQVVFDGSIVNGYAPYYQIYSHGSNAKNAQGQEKYLVPAQWVRHLGVHRANNT